MLFTSPAVPIIPIIEQIPLIQVVNEDDQTLLNSPGAEWFRILNNFPWQEHRDMAAACCDALYDFNSSGGLRGGGFSGQFRRVGGRCEAEAPFRTLHG